MIAMMLTKKVKSGNTEMSLFEAYELRDGRPQLKVGVEFNDTQFDDFTGKMHSILKDLNGNYNEFDRPLIEKYSLGRMAFFMRKYFVPMVSRRFSTLHVDMEAGTFKEGYYRTFVNSFLKDLFTLQLDLSENWQDYTKAEKQAILRVAMEAGIIVTIMLLLLLMGYYDDERDFKIDAEGVDNFGSMKFWKLHLMYLLLRTRSEAENFIPAPGLGFNELYNQATTPSLAIRYIGNLIQITDQTRHLIFGNDEAFYDRKYGVWDKGDWKIWAKLLKTVGLTGNFLHPDLMIRNIENAQRVK
jgi:hypothetical protein